MTEIPAPPTLPPGDRSAPPAGELTLQHIQEYVWMRYVEFLGAPFELDEAKALAFYEAHYREHPLSEDSECFYYGILAYEHAFAGGEPDRALLRTALRAFQAYRDQTASHFSWDVVEDRYADAMDSL